MAIAYMALARPGPRMAITATASNRLGSASRTSIRRMIEVSTLPPAKAAISPRTMPIDSDSVTEMRPIDSARRVPKIRRDSMSRPTASVPSR